MEKNYRLEGLDCPNCAMKIEKALNEKEEINKASVNAVTQKCMIEYKEYNEEIEKKVIHMIEDLEDVKVIRSNKKSHHDESELHHHHHHDQHSHHHHEHEEESCHDHENECCCNHEHHEHKERIKPETNDLIKIKWTIEGLDCANCALKVEDAVNETEGVEYASLNFTTKSLIFYLKKETDSEMVKENVKKAIQNVEEVEIITGEKHQETDKNKRQYWIILGGILVIILGLVFKNNLMLVVSYLMIGYNVILKALKNIRRKEIFDENFLMMIATVGAIVVGEYLEAIAVMLFYQIGEYFQDLSVEKSRRNITELMNIKAETAHLLKEDRIIDVDPEEIEINDIILIQPGERVPLDGEVIDGSSTLDTSALSGESMPSEIQKKDVILAGCINLTGVLKVKVTKTSDESTVSRILDMVENASAKKAVTELKMTRFARVYTPIVVISAIILAVVPNFIISGVSWQEWLLRACTFLVISCPCALVLSIPLGYFAGIGSASKKGILVKGGNYLELLHEVDTIVFDKTGTLTKGTFKVTQIDSENQEQCLKLAALAESYSTHPIALSILNEYGKEIDKTEIEDIEEIAGKGIKAVYQGKILLAGNKKLMNEFGIQAKDKTTAGTLVYVAYDHQFKGIIEISDTLKENTISSLKALKEKGIKKLIMLSGDRKETAMMIAEKCGLDEVHYELLPNQKVTELEKIMSDSHKVAYVGDGINDAPVLARCDVGIAMGGLGSEAAVEASDIVLMKDDLSALPKGIDLAHFTQKIMNENIIFILLVKFIILILTIFGYANMWMGVFADVGVSILAVLNSMRILKY